MAGVIIIGLWMLQTRAGLTVPYLFAKEGLLEDLTFVLEFLACGFCAAAAIYWTRGRGPVSRAVPALFALLAMALFLVAMEEINWGQTLFGFSTPQAWAEVNYQHETSLHNLVGKSVLTSTWKLVAVAFGIGAVALMVLGTAAPRSIAGAIAPHPTLLPLALMTSYSGVRLHPEIIEVLLSIFFAFYGYRIFIASRSLSFAGPQSGAALPLGGRMRKLAADYAPRRSTKVVVAVVLLTLLLSRFDWVTAAQDVQGMSPWTFVGVAVLIGLGLVISAGKWSCALRLHSLEYPFPYLFRVLCIGFFFNSFLPTAVGGDVYRVYRTLPMKHYRSRALSAVMVERAVGLLALLALGGVGAVLLADAFAAARLYCIALLVGTAAGAVGIFALQRGWFESVLARGDRVPALNALHHNLGQLKGRGKLWLLLLGGSIAFQMTSIGAVFLLFNDLLPEVTIAQVALITAAVGVAAALPISVSGIGVMEGAFVAAAVALGLDYDQALTVALLRRFIAVLLSASCGVLYLHETKHSEGVPEHESIQSWLRRALHPSVDETPQPTETAPPEIVPLTASREAWSQMDLLEFTHDAIIIWEMSGAGIQYWNRAAEQLYGFSREEAHGRTTHTLLQTRLTEGVNQLEAKLARYGIWVGELRHTARDGRAVLVEGRLALLAQQGGKWLVLEVNRDITDRRKAEAAQRATLEQLARLRRVATRDGPD